MTSDFIWAGFQIGAVKRNYRGQSASFQIGALKRNYRWRHVSSARGARAGAQ
jgi:hypothetical protein